MCGKYGYCGHREPEIDRALLDSWTERRNKYVDD
jgi:hypothetical protein